MSQAAALVHLDDAQWDALVETSPQASPFNRREFLDSLGTRSVRLGLVNGPDVLAGVAVQLDDRNLPVGPPDTFGFYQGILLSAQFASLPEHSRSLRELDTMGELLAGLAKIFPAIWLGLHWCSRDLRALQWFNYHEPQAGQFQLALRYTGIIDLSPFAAIDAYLRTLGERRRRNYRKARTGGIVVRNSDDVDLLDRLHRLTFGNQGADRGCFERQLKPMANAALQHGFGELLVAWTPAGDAISASLFIWDRTTSHYLFGANDPASRSTGAATLLMVENFARAMQRGIHRIDMVGINSPQRGEFKTSFNAAPVPYFDAHWRRPA